jgi:hypothetical protein
MGEPPVAFRSSQFFVDFAGVYNIITVSAPRSRLQIGGGVKMADPEVPKVVGDGCGIIKREFLMKLHPIRGSRYLHPFYPDKALNRCQSSRTGAA